ncbi:MAG: GNAT family N-acetyltransferase [Clostridia bacterium]|nr:GNAT family N-acetyltransferase [Clostridia bacterium]
MENNVDDMNLSIREANINDIDKGLLEVFIEGYRYHQNGRPDIFANLSDEELKNELIQRFDKLTTIVILDGDNIVGHLSYIIKKRKTGKLDVDELVILERYRGKGLGKKLMDEAKRIAKENGCNRIELNCWLFNENALEMYEHIGYKRQRIIYEMKL